MSQSQRHNHNRHLSQSLSRSNSQRLSQSLSQNGDNSLSVDDDSSLSSSPAPMQSQQPSINLQDEDVVKYGGYKGKAILAALKANEVIEKSKDSECGTILKGDIKSFYTQLQTADGTSLTWVLCGGNEKGVRHALKLITRKGTSYTSTSLLNHPCYKN